MGEKKKDVVVPSSTTDGKDKSDDDDEKKSTKTTGKDAKPEIELSEEDLQLKTNLELLVQRVMDSKAGVAKLALESMRTEIKTATSSMTSVPKPLKFLRPHLQTFKDQYPTIKDATNKKLLADVISVLSMTDSPGENIIPESLKYKMLGSGEEVGFWGHEYVRNLASEIGIEYHGRADLEEGEEGVTAKDKEVDDLMKLVKDIVPFHMSHNAEPEAVDLLIEVEKLEYLIDHVTENNYSRTCLYLISCSSYLPEPEDGIVLSTAHKIFMKVNKLCDAMRVALKIGVQSTIEETFLASKDPLEKKQLCYILARHGHPLKLDEGPCEQEGDDAEELTLIMSNSKLCENYLTLARDLDVMEAKIPEDIYKTHLIEGRAPSGPAVDSARANLAATFVNAFVNAGFGHDKLLTAQSAEGTTGEGGSSSNVSWIFKNKDHGKMSAAASLGSVLLWDVEGGLPQVDTFLYSEEPLVVAGGLLAVGLINTNVRNDCDPAYGLLYESVNKDNSSVRIGAIMGLGLAYAGCQKEEVAELLTPIVTDESTPMDVCAFAALSLGLVYCGTCHEESVQSIVQALMLRPEKDLEDPFAHLMCLGLGLMFLQRQQEVEATLEVAKTFPERISEYCQVVLDVCAYACSGNVLKVQALLAKCGEHRTTEESTEVDSWKLDAQSVACLGIAIIAMGEDLGRDMAIRSYDHLIQYGDNSVKLAIPLGLAMLHTSDPKLEITDQLGRLSHDNSEEIAQSACLALGIVGAGTNNARLAHQLRQLTSYYYKEPSLLFLVRVSQGLVHLGKGLLTLSPTHSDRTLQSSVSLAGLMITCFAGLDMKHTILGKHHYMLYYLFAAAVPRMLMCVDEEGKALPIPVRVGQAVDVVGQAGRPKTITGFQTHTTPVLLASGDRAELESGEYIPITSNLENVVIMKKNPAWEEEDAKK
jgi:26S proteasome regulatory subunit N1